MTFSEFWAEATYQLGVANPAHRAGQVYMNTLFNVDMGIYYQIKDTEFDCSTDDLRIPVFVREVKRLFQEQGEFCG
jgi:hypothetical protein